MAGINRLEGASPARISTNFTVGNQTQNRSFGEKVNAGLQQGANALASGAALLGAAGVPGVGIISAAVSSVTARGGTSTAGYAATGVVNVGGSTTVGTVGAGGGTGGDGGLGGVGGIGGAGGGNFNAGASSNDVGFGNNAMGSMSADMSNMLKLQYSMQKENMMYTSISNVLKTKHDTAKNSISNVR